MYFDNLTIVSLLVFAIAFGSFVYACIIRGCLSDSDDTAGNKQGPALQREKSGRHRHDGE